MKISCHVTAALAALVWTTAAGAAQFLSPNDFVIAIDVDAPISLSNSPGAEGPENALDSFSGTKYLNFGELNTGIMVTPASGASIVQSMVLTTANDAAERDPASWAIYGTNEAIDLLAPGVNHGNSLIANWQLIAQGNVALPAARETIAPVLSFANSTSYANYRILFPTVRNAGTANSMQIADIDLYATNDGTGTNIISAFDNVAAFQLPSPDSRYPVNQNPTLAIDGTGPNNNFFTSQSPGNEQAPMLIDDDVNTKYLNFGEVDSGFIITPAGGPSQVRSFVLSTANDAEPRDPASWQLFGTNAPIVSPAHSTGLGEAWTLIDSGTVELPPDRFTPGPVVTVNNAASFASYKMVYTSVKDDIAANSMQLAEASFFASVDGSGADLLNPGDAILPIDATVFTGLQTKYLNFGETNSGLIVTPAAGAKTITGLKITTGDDAPERDPATFQLYGTNSPIMSADNSIGNGETWTLIASGDLNLPDERVTEGALIAITNSTSYTSYRIVFPTVKDDVLADSMQITGLEFFDSSVVEDVDLDNDGDVDGNDFIMIQRTAPNLIAAWRVQYGAGGGASANAGSVPEPTAAVLALVAMAAATRFRARNGRRQS